MSEEGNYTIDDMPQMPETSGFVRLYREAQSQSGPDRDQECWVTEVLNSCCDDVGTMITIGVACVALVAAASYAIYKWLKQEDENFGNKVNKIIKQE